MAVFNGMKSLQRIESIRRRRQDKPAISARLVLDDHMEGHVGVVSEDLVLDLFPDLGEHCENDERGRIHYLALAPWSSKTAPSDTTWLVVPVTQSRAVTPSTVHFSPFSPALQSFAGPLQELSPSSLPSHGRGGTEILVLDVSPLPLETVFISLESESAKRLENGEGTFPERPSRPSERIPAEDPLVTALRASLKTLEVVHCGDLFALPLAPHPVTHVPPNPGKIILCEPVAQGVLDDATRIVLIRGRHKEHCREPLRIAEKRRFHVPDENDSNTDQFYSAAEERYQTDGQVEDAVTEMETEQSATEQEDELSDDSMDEMISLQAPTLPSANGSGIPTIQPSTPMTIGPLRGRRTNGAVTPGSVFSNVTSATARPDFPTGCLFKAHNLARPIPPDMLHPRPSSEEDEEARIYVDIKSLPKIGCFSGDWARVEVAQEPPLHGFGPFGLSSFGSMEAQPSTWRPLRVYGLPECYSHRPVRRIAGSRAGQRRMSFFESQVQQTTSPVVHVSPILLANLENATLLRISPLKKPAYHAKGPLPRFGRSSHPPYAKDIAIHHIRTPTSAERAYQTAVLGGLKRYFAKKIRLVRPGDLIAVPVDAQLGRALQETAGSGTSEIDDVAALTAAEHRTGRPSTRIDSVAWFKVGRIQVQKIDDGEEDMVEAFWGSVACIDSASVGMHGSGFETSRVPGLIRSSWPSYLGLKKVPREAPNTRPPSAPEPRNSFTSPLRRRLRDLVAASTSPRAIHLKMPPIAVLITSTHRNIGKATLAAGACADIGLHVCIVDSYDILGEGGSSGNDVKTEGLLRSRAERAISCGPDCCALLVQHIEALTGDRIESALKEVMDESRILIATANEVEQIPDAVRTMFTHELEMEAPGEVEREVILRNAVDDRGLMLEPSMNLNSIALKTAALVAGDLVDVVERASLAQFARLESLSAKTGNDGASISVRDIQVAGGSHVRSLTAADFEIAVEAARKTFSDAIGAPKIPNVTWNDVGGMSHITDAIAETIQLPLERPDLFAKGMKKRSGILFYGPPGTGKTLLAKAIATEYSLNFFSVKGPELLNMYIGESEANVRRVFQRARDARPCVVFFDELDSVAPKRGNQGDSGGVMDRIVSQLLAELDGMSGGDDVGGVFVVGATNRPDLLDPALLRPGRFDKMLYLGVPDTHEKQKTVLEALTRKFALHPSLSLGKLAQRLPFNYTGADFYALCSDAMLQAVTRQASAVDAKLGAINAERKRGPRISTAYFFDHYATEDDNSVMVTEADFTAANEELVPSVSPGELAHYEKVRAAFEGSRENQPKAGALSLQYEPSSFSSRNDLVFNSPEMVPALSHSKGKGKAVTTDMDNSSEEGTRAKTTNGLPKGRGKARGALRVVRDGSASDE